MNKTLLKKFVSLETSLLKQFAVLGVLCLSICVSYAQTTVSGNIKSGEDSSPLPGVNVLIKDTNVGTVTDFDGKFTVTVPSSDAVLVFSYVGYENSEVQVGSQSVINVTLNPNTETLSEVIVTALGISRKTKTIGYSTQTVKPQTLTNVNTPNLGNMLTGQVAGLTVNNPTGLLQAPSFQLRGRTPLIVLDGIPIETNMFNVSANDIASVTVLKGTAASALYGSRGKDGAIMITTKTADKEGLDVTFTQSTMMTAGFSVFPETQTEYGNGSIGKYEFWDGKDGGISDGDMIWGPKFGTGQLVPQWNSPIVDNVTGKEIPWWGDVSGTAYDDKSRYSRKPIPWEYHNNLKDFLKTGIVSTTDFSISSKSEKALYRFSGKYSKQKGQVPNSDLYTGGVNFNATNYLTKSLTLDTKISYNKVYSNNYPRHGYGPRNHMYTILIWMGDDVNGKELEQHQYIPGQEGYRQANFNYAWYNNVYFAANELNQKYDETLLNGLMRLNWKITDDLSIFARASVVNEDRFENRESPKTYLNYGDPRDGDYKTWNYDRINVDKDVLLTYSKNFSSNFKFEVNAGASSFYRRIQSEYAASDGLIVPWVYSLNNSKNNVKASTAYQAKEIRSAYTSLNFEFLDAFFLNVSGRNEWSSTFTEANRSYFYPSASLSAIVSKFIPLPDAFDYLKVFTSYANVSTDFDPYQLESAYGNAGTFGNNTKFTYPQSILNPDILPQRSTSFELGVETAVLENKGSLAFTYYNIVDDNFIIALPMSYSTGFANRLVNGNEYTTNGFEAVVTVTPVKTATLTYTVMANWARKIKRITDIYGGAKKYGNLSLGDRTDSYWGTGWQKSDDGKLIINESSGLPIRDPYPQMFGFTEPNGRFGIQNTFQFNKMRIDVGFDGVYGGIMRSLTVEKMWWGGKHPYSTTYRDEEYAAGQNVYLPTGVNVVSGSLVKEGDGSSTDTRVYKENATKVSWQTWSQQYPYRANVGLEESDVFNNLFNRSFIKLRNITLTYDITDLVSLKGIKKLEVAAYGYNLLILKKMIIVDPDFGDDNQLQDPSARYLGLRLNVNF